MTNTLAQIAYNGNAYARQIYNAHKTEYRNDVLVSSVFMSFAIGAIALSSLPFVRGVHLVGYICCSFAPIPLVISGIHIYRARKSHTVLKEDKEKDIKGREDLKAEIRKLTARQITAEEALSGLKQAAGMSDEAVE